MYGLSNTLGNNGISSTAVMMATMTAMTAMATVITVVSMPAEIIAMRARKEVMTIPEREPIVVAISIAKDFNDGNRRDCGCCDDAGSGDGAGDDTAEDADNDNICADDFGDGEAVGDTPGDCVSDTEDDDDDGKSLLASMFLLPLFVFCASLLALPPLIF